jgi:hypothetical protein
VIAAEFLGFYFGGAVIRGFERPGIDDLVTPGQKKGPVRLHMIASRERIAATMNRMQRPGKPENMNGG